MDIIFAKKQYKNVFFPNYEESFTEDDAILYFEDQEKIVVMNSSAICVWNYLVQQIKDSCSSTVVTLDDLIEVIKSNFTDTVGIDDEISNDIIEIVDSFFEGGLLNCKP